jgi:hypothetical protein
MLRSLTLAALVLSSIPGCASQDAQATPSQKPVAASTASPAPQCTDVLVRARACTDQYIPMLVDLRAKLDHPAGIADAVKADRNGVIAQAKAEWANDSTDASIAQTCATNPGLPGDAETAATCLAKTDCAEFTACIAPLFEKHLTK